MTDRMEVSDMGRKKQISDQRRLYTERMRLQKGVFSSLSNAAGHIGELYADFVQSDVGMFAAALTGHRRGRKHADATENLRT